ncbi:MAG: amidohydrolase family protein [Oscillospiraceae bacterium]|nr:amidohydrolase family protein [Oscillospiraceae bacterium]
MELRDHAVLGRELKDTFVVDVHTHIGSHNNYQRVGTDAEAIIHTMDRLGVDKILCSNSPGAYSDLRWGNEVAAKAHTKYPDRILALAVGSPHCPEIDWDDYFIRDDRFFGMKAVPFVQGQQPIWHEGLMPMYEYADKKGLAVLFHAWLDSETRDAIKVAKQFPNARFILGHAGYTAREAAVEACKQCDNVILETTFSAPIEGDLEWIVGKVGTDRVAYGSDLTAFECAHILGSILLSRLTDTEKEKILGLNAKAFFGL